jgi:plastocyanin
MKGGSQHMRKALLLVVSIVALAAGAVALAAVTKVVAIKPAGFSPATQTITTGDSIRWRNDDTTDHQVVADNGLFASPILKPKATYTKTFTTSGTYNYRDTFEPAERGKIIVKGPPPSVSIASSSGAVFFGAAIHVTGFISSGAANQTVEIWSRPVGQGSFAKAVELKTVSGGGYDWSTIPDILTEYQAKWGSRSSIVASVAVRPRLSFIRRAPYFVASAKSGSSTTGRWVYVQRRSALGQWVNIKKVRLGSSGARRFKLTLKPGRNLLRLFMTTNQAGSGYLWSNSRSLLIKKRR